MGAATWKGSSRDEQKGNDGGYNTVGSPNKESSNSFGNPRGSNQGWAGGE
jgi:hypothetical protein